MSTVPDPSSSGLAEASRSTGAGDRDVRSTLQERTVHDSWTKAYRTPENDRFYETAFDYVSEVFGPPGTEPVLDAGCGSSVKSIQLARRGYTVRAVDFSESILEVAKVEVAKEGLQHLVTHEWADLTALPFPDGTFGRVLCWGVLMHVPNVEGAIAELARVTRPGGVIVVSENNVRSLHTRTFQLLRAAIRQKRDRKRVPAGLETWEDTPHGKVITRHADVDWMIDRFARGGARLTVRRAGEFTQIFTLIPWKPLRRLVHGLNGVWFRKIRAAGPALGNLLVFTKQ